MSSSVPLDSIPLPNISDEPFILDLSTSTTKTLATAECIPLDDPITNPSSSSPTLDICTITQMPNVSSSQIRKSTRVHRLPTYLQDYSCSLLSTKPLPSSPYDINSHLSYANLSSSYQVFALVASAKVELEYYH